MCSGIILGEKIDILIKELGLTQKEFAKQICISPSTIATWKSKNILPPIETINMIADFFQVSLEWLVTEDSISEISDHQKILLLRKDIRNRIYEIICKKTRNPDADSEAAHKRFFSNMPYLSYRILYNWSKGRINLNEYVLVNIAYSLGVTIEYLFTGIDSNTHSEDKAKSEEKSKQQLNDLNGEFDNETEFTENNKYILKTAHRNLNDLFCLDNLTEERKSTAHSILNQLMELEHLKYVEKQKAEKTDSE